MDKVLIELLYNHKEVCEKLFSYDVEGAFQVAKKKINRLQQYADYPNRRLKKRFLHYLNHSVYHYLLFCRNCAFEECCYENCQNIKFTGGWDELLKVTKHILFSYYQQFLLLENPNLHIREACQFIEEHLEENLTLERVATQIFVSRCYLCQLFKEKTQENFLQYVTRRRMERAGLLLRTTPFSVDQVAEKCGFSSAAYFSYVFRKKFGVSPSEYRRMLSTNNSSDLKN